jgi:hypothetical protein
MGYTPVFGSVFTGSLCGQYPDTAAWLYLLALADRNGHVDVTPEYISAITGMPVQMLVESINRFLQPDPKSRNPADDGRRLVRLDPQRPWGWRIVNHAAYRERARLMGKAAAEVASGENRRRLKGRRRTPVTAGDRRRTPPTAPQTQTQTHTQTRVTSETETPAKAPATSCETDFDPEADKGEALQIAGEANVDCAPEVVVAKFVAWLTENPSGNWREALRTWARREYFNEAQYKARKARERAGGAPPIAAVEQLNKKFCTTGNGS